jgi:hypothetical protein
MDGIAQAASAIEEALVQWEMLGFAAPIYNHELLW